jgi:ankyrin repeat protein
MRVLFFLILSATASLAGSHSRMSLHDAAANADVKTINRLIKKKHYLVDGRDNLDNTPLHYLAGQSLHVDDNQLASAYIALRFQHYAKVNAKNKFGQTPLMTAVIYENLRVIQIILENDDLFLDADINATDLQGKSALHLAVFSNNLNIAKILTQYGADPHLKDKNDCSPLYYAGFLGRNEMVEHMVKEMKVADEKKTEEQIELKAPTSSSSKRATKHRRSRAGK